jgi:hypothetical protein
MAHAPSHIHDVRQFQRQAVSAPLASDSLTEYLQAALQKGRRRDW